MENLEFYQLRKDDVKLCELPLYCTKIDKSCIYITTFMYLIPLPSNPYALRNNTSKLKEIYEWCVGTQIASELMPEETETKENNYPNNDIEIVHKFNLIVH
eukprot:154776_1